LVAERSVCAEAVEVTRRGAYRSENVGISSTTAGENPARRKPKVSWATKIDPGLVGPKVRPKGVADGQQVNIPAQRRDYPLNDACPESVRYFGYDRAARRRRVRKDEPIQVKGGPRKV